ncbi:MAG: methyltransferase domain-containing protein [Oligoflexia bacterium]|nr:methyltransferase domain-containing protein [Oligoflexia bacterium]
MANQELTKEYVLGTGQDELDRLGLQHRIWADAAVSAWKRAGIGPGSKVLDLGCGPGFASLELAQLVTSKGKVIAVDESKGFVSHLNQQAAKFELPHLQAYSADAQNLQSTLNDKGFDAVYCRWLLCWLPEPQKALAEVKKILKPGGRFVIHDYFNWRAMCSAPRSKPIEKMVQAAVASFEERNGNVDIAASLPKLLRETGFVVSDFSMHARVARGGGLDSTFAWVSTWWHTYGPKLVQMGKLSQSDCEQALLAIDEIGRNPDQFFVCPPVFEFIAKAP